MTADVIVIGAGIIGSACAHELSKRGLSVRVLDSGQAGATGAGMGHLVTLDDNPAELALSRYSLDLWRQWADQLDDACAYRNCGTLWLAANEEELHEAARKADTLGKHGIACELMGARQLQALEPHLAPSLKGALCVSGDGILYAPNAARWLLHQGGSAITLEHARVTAVSGTHVQLEDGRRLDAGAVILANGIQAPELCPELPIEPKKGHLLITDRYPGQIHHQLVELGYASSAHASTGTSVAFNAQPRPTGQILLGSSRQFDTLDPCVEGPVLARMLARARQYLPGLGDLNAIRCWTGFRATTPDGLPIIGQHPEQPGLWLAVGHEGLGVTTAPGTARLLAAELFGESLPLSGAAYRPGRFTTAHAVGAEG